MARLSTPSPSSWRSTRWTLLSPEAMAETLAEFRKRVRKAPLVMSGATGQGVREALAKLLTEVDKRRPAPASRNGRDDHSGPDGPDEWHP